MSKHPFELMILDLRNIQSAIDFEVASANRELTQFGQWSSDHAAAITGYNQEFAYKLKQAQSEASLLQ